MRLAQMSSLADRVGQALADLLDLLALDQRRERAMALLQVIGRAASSRHGPADKRLA